MSDHPDAKLTLREFFEKHYDKEDISEGTLRHFRHCFNHWERLTGNPPIAEIDNATLAKFRQDQIDEGFSPASINSRWTMYRAVLRRASRPESGNPRGLGAIDLVPWMKKVKEPYKIPRRIDLDDLSRFYQACRHIQLPKTIGFTPAWWWQCLIVLAYCTGLRKSDLLSIRRTDVNFDNQTLFVSAKKTGKTDLFPLHSVAVEHIRRIWEPERELLFRPDDQGINERAVTDRMKLISAHAGVEHFTLQNVRSTAASEAEKVRSGAAALLLQHARRDVTGRHYLDLSDILRDVIEKLPIPLAFKHGINMEVKAEEKAQRERQQQQTKMKPRDFASPGKPEASEWMFRTNAFWFRGQWYSIHTKRGLMLKTLAKSDQPVSFTALAKVWFGPQPNIHSQKVQGRVHAEVSELRKILRKCLNLSQTWDPVPCVKRGEHGRWTLFLPPNVGFDDRTDSILTPIGLQQARIRLGLTQREVAGMLRVRRNTVTSWERGWTRPGKRYVAKLLELLGGKTEDDDTEAA